jgi:hypothetical protein
MEIDLKLFEAPSGQRLPRIEKLTEAYQIEFEKFLQEQKEKKTMNVDSQSMNSLETGMDLNQH